MKRCNRKQLSFEIFFPENLEKTWCKIYNKQSEEYDKGKDDSRSHIEEVEQRSDKPSQSERSAITHKDLGGMYIVKHKSYQHSNHDSNYGRSDIGLIKK